jgi:hypothetical protein
MSAKRLLMSFLDSFDFLLCEVNVSDVGSRAARSARRREALEYVRRRDLPRDELLLILLKTLIAISDHATLTEDPMGVRIATGALAE